MISRVLSFAMPTVGLRPALATTSRSRNRKRSYSERTISDDVACPNGRVDDSPARLRRRCRRARCFSRRAKSTYTTTTQDTVGNCLPERLAVLDPRLPSDTCVCVCACVKRKKIVLKRTDQMNMSRVLGTQLRDSAQKRSRADEARARS